MNSSTSSNSTASSSFSQGVASDSIGSSGIIPTRKSRMGNFVDILIKLLALLVGGIQVYLFYEYACKRDGEWSNWGKWSKCNGGLRLRSRYCSSPSPSLFGQYCQGSSEQYQICNLVSCKDGKQSLLGSEHRSSDTFIHTTELRNELLNRLSQVSKRIEKLEINLEKQGNLIEDEHKQTLVLEKLMKGDRDERLQQDVVIQKEVKAIKDEIKSDTDKAEEEHSELLNEVKDDIKLLSTDHSNLMKQMSTVVKDTDEQAKITFKKLDYYKHSYETFEASTNNIVKDYKISVSNDLRDFKQEITTSVHEVKEQTEKSISKVSKELVKISHMGKGLQVAFTAYGSGTETYSTVIKFPVTHFNSGGAYSTSTGRFTCKITGIYHFAVALTKIRKNIDYVSAYIRINDVDKLQLFSDPDDTDGGHVDFGSYSLSAAGTFHLNVNDFVYIYSRPSNYYNDYTSSFTGFLVIPDTL